VVRAQQSATLTWKTNGTVETVYARLGETVQPGDILAELAQNSILRNVALAEPELVSAQKALDELFGSASTEKANAAIALCNAQDAYDEAVNYRELLDYEIKYEFEKRISKLKITAQPAVIRAEVNPSTGSGQASALIYEVSYGGISL